MSMIGSDATIVSRTRLPTILSVAGVYWFPNLAIAAAIRKLPRVRNNYRAGVLPRVSSANYGTRNTVPMTEVLTLHAQLTHRMPLLITGVAGVAGFNAFYYFRDLFPRQVVGIRSPQTGRLVDEGIVALDGEDEEGMKQLFRQHHFRAVLNCTGNCALKSCELDPWMAYKLNVASARVVASLAARAGCRLVHLSSDLVFAGREGGEYRETDPVDPVTIYGKTMVQAENEVESACPEAAILRISLPMGPSFNRHAGAIDWIDSRFRNHRPATLYFDEVRSSTYTDDLNRLFAWFLQTEYAGLYHAGGPQPLALYQIAQIVNRVGGYDPRLLKGCPRVAAGPMPPRAGNVSMCSKKLLDQLGGQPFHPWPLGADLLPTCRDWHFQRSPNEHGSFDQIRARLYHGANNSTTTEDSTESTKQKNAVHYHV